MTQKGRSNLYTKQPQFILLLLTPTFHSNRINEFTHHHLSSSSSSSSHLPEEEAQVVLGEAAERLDVAADGAVKDLCVGCEIGAF